jgi:hypothetical protein
MGVVTPEGSPAMDPEVHRIFLISELEEAVRENAVCAATTFSKDHDYLSVISGRVEPFFTDDLDFFSDTRLALVVHEPQHVTVIRRFDNGSIRRSDYLLDLPDSERARLGPETATVDSHLRFMLSRTTFSAGDSEAALEQLRRSGSSVVSDLKKRIRSLEATLRPGQPDGNPNTLS